MLPRVSRSMCRLHLIPAALVCVTAIEHHGRHSIVFDLFYPARNGRLAQRVVADLARSAPPSRARSTRRPSQCGTERASGMAPVRLPRCGGQSAGAHACKAARCGGVHVAEYHASRSSEKAGTCPGCPTPENHARPENESRSVNYTQS